MISGIKLLEEREGEGLPAQRGDVVRFDSRGFLNRGDQIQEKCETTTRLGDRDLIAGIEKSLEGMKTGGYRKVKISPHLAYRDQGVEGKIPPDAVLIYELWMKGIGRGANNGLDDAADSRGGCRARQP